MSKAKSGIPPPQKTRNKLGQFVPGNKASKGAGGRPRMLPEIKQIAQEISHEGMQVVQQKLKAGSFSDKDMLTALRLCMEYGYGRPAAEFDRERLELDKARFEAERKEADAAGNAKVEVIISKEAKEWGE